MRTAMAMIALCAMAGMAAAAPPDPRGDPDQFRRDIEALNRKPLPAGEPLASAVGAAVALDSQQRGRCAPGKIRLGPLEPVSLDGMITRMIAQGQIENAWLVSVRLDNCPPADPIRVLLFRSADGAKLQGLFAGQGESLAWPTLSRETLRITVTKAVAKLRLADPKCTPRDLTPIAVRIAERSPDLGPNVYGIRLKGWWSEVWAFDPCGHRIAVPVRFTTDGKGGAYWDIDESRIVYAP
jgi:hypothetical protein